MPRADDIACSGVRADVATPEVTICLIEGQHPFDREVGYFIGALHLVRSAAAQRNDPGAGQAIEEDRRRLGAIDRSRLRIQRTFARADRLAGYGISCPPMANRAWSAGDSYLWLTTRSQRMSACGESCFIVELLPKTHAMKLGKSIAPSAASSAAVVTFPGHPLHAGIRPLECSERTSQTDRASVAASTLIDADIS
jgi:hypothetical protein